MPVKNAERFLAQCLQSIVDQTEQYWELIAVDDDSTDNSLSVLQKFAESDARISVLQNTGNGIIDALRLAYSHSEGEFITRMDADDKMAKTKLQTLKRSLKNSGIGHLAVGQVEYFSESVLGDGYKRYESWLNKLTAEGANYSDIYKECVIPSPCWMIFRDDLKQCDAFNPNTYPEDYDLCFRFYREKLNVIPCQEILHYWRDHPDRSSRNDANYADNRFIELKTNWFLKLDHQPEKKLIVWGAGKKGKQIAQLLSKLNIPFRWVCNNPNKIGKDIYGVIMESTKTLKSESNLQLIFSVANPEEQASIKQDVKHMGTWFC